MCPRLHNYEAHAFTSIYSTPTTVFTVLHWKMTRYHPYEDARIRRQEYLMARRALSAGESVANARTNRVSVVYPTAIRNPTDVDAARLPASSAPLRIAFANLVNNYNLFYACWQFHSPQLRTLGLLTIVVHPRHVDHPHRRPPPSTDTHQPTAKLHPPHTAFSRLRNVHLEGVKAKPEGELDATSGQPLPRMARALRLSGEPFVQIKGIASPSSSEPPTNALPMADLIRPYPSIPARRVFYGPDGQTHRWRPATNTSSMSVELEDVHYSRGVLWNPMDSNCYIDVGVVGLSYSMVMLDEAREPTIATDVLFGLLESLDGLPIERSIRAIIYCAVDTDMATTGLTWIVLPIQTEACCASNWSVLRKAHMH
ncbi:hypothetical protein FISHEDRAFT_56091 [Fistulina hepatica ATCC 64428]|uniref:Uncharacterized protein n=1 Tax=Fistulina hepatica ATCC 64428 TaxID=1128425 RepID=A0A0D7AM39_9AGAR|nr:hypothetical protein FISHEDRAFT_56091 [Fistulina hepatica ATCC 64428]